MDKKVFCIGLNKTGTTSIEHACKKLSFKVNHGPYEFNQLVLSPEKSDNILARMPQYNAFSDIFFPNGMQNINKHLMSNEYRQKIIQALYEQNPEAYFILNTRDMASWLESRKKHVYENLKNKQYCNSKKAKWVEIDEKKWKQEYVEHHESVLNFFQGKKILIFDVCKGDGYSKLCSFLNLDIVREDFPKKNERKK